MSLDPRSSRKPLYRVAARCSLTGLLAQWLMTICGCPSLETLPTQAPITTMTEERTHGGYQVYVPSTYSAKRTWPLLVVCHGTWPYDSAALQMQEWASFAEGQGIIVAAPALA